MPSAMSPVVETRSWNSASSSKLCSRLDSKLRLASRLVRLTALVGRRRNLAASSSTVASSSIGRHDAVDQADAIGFGGRAVLAEEHQLLGPMQPDQAGQQIAAAGVRHDARAARTPR